MVVASPKSPESSDIGLASEPWTQLTVANVSQKHCLQSTLDAFSTVPLDGAYCQSPFNFVLFPCIIGLYHILP